MNTTTEKFHSTTPGYRGTANYVLPFDKADRFNPLDPDSHPFGRVWLVGMHVVMVRKTDAKRPGPSRSIAGWGPPMGGWLIGDVWYVKHDQTDAALGTYEVVGIVTYDDEGNVSEVVGNVPARPTSTATFK